MDANLLFSFTADKANDTIVIKREFASDLKTVWHAWTDPAVLDQWIAPKPWRAQTQAMDFREGGFWHYAMIGPNGEKHFSRYDYQKIEPEKCIVELRAFTDEVGTVNPAFPRTVCTNVFSQSGGKVLVTITAKYGSPAVLEYMLTRGFREGMAAGFENLDAWLSDTRK